MQAFYDSKPSVLEAVGNGSYKYRYGIEEVAATGSDEEQRTQYRCEEVTVWSPLTSNKITQAVIVEKWEGDYESKLQNEYNAATLGLYDEETATAKRAAYTAFLSERMALKEQVDADCAELGIK